MTDLEWPTWRAERYTYRVESLHDNYGGEFVVTREALEEDRFSHGQLRAYLLRSVMVRAEQDTGRSVYPESFDVALIDDRFPHRPLARHVLARLDRDPFIRDELRKQAR